MEYQEHGTHSKPSFKPVKLASNGENCLVKPDSSDLLKEVKSLLPSRNQQHENFDVNISQISEDECMMVYNSSKNSELVDKETGDVKKVSKRFKMHMNSQSTKMILLVQPFLRN